LPVAIWPRISCHVKNFASKPPRADDENSPAARREFRAVGSHGKRAGSRTMQMNDLNSSSGKVGAHSVPLGDAPHSPILRPPANIPLFSASRRKGDGFWVLRNRAVAVVGHGTLRGLGLHPSANPRSLPVHPFRGILRFHVAAHHHPPSSPSLLRKTLRAAARFAHAQGMGWLANDVSWLLAGIRERGFAGGVSALRRRFVARQRLQAALRGEQRSTGAVRVATPLADHPLELRKGTSDPLVYAQVFIEDEYGPFATDAIEGLVIDCGANVGYSSALFLSRWPRCTVVAVEPDPDNFRMLVDNLRPYGSRAVLVHGGVWNKTGRLALSSAHYRDGDFWARQVVPASSEVRDSFPAFDIPSLMALARADRVALLKVDIEGAEAIVFDETCSRWIHAVDRIAIEIHDDTSFGDCREIFAAAIAAEGFTVAHSGELTLCRRRKAMPGQHAAG